MTKSTPFSELSRRFQEVVGSLEASAHVLLSAENRELLTLSEHAREEVAACRKALETSFVTIAGGRKLRMVEHEALMAFARAHQLGEDVVLASVVINDAGRVTEGRFNEDSVTDISALAGLTALTYLELGAPKVSDVSPLVGLTALTYLSLTGTEISDVSPLARLMALTYLYLNGTKVSDLSPVTRPGLKVTR